MLFVIEVVGQKKDSTITVTAGEHYLKSGFHQFWWGKHYRKVWAEPVEAPLFWVKEFKGGVTPIKQGGSFQTKNLRLEDSLGREFVLRSVDKDPSKALPKSLQNTFVAGLMRDQTSVIHPYGAFIVPELANAAGVYHTNPKLVFIPDDPALGKYRQEFANTLALLEERPDDANWANLASFGNPANIVSSKKAISSLLKKPLHQVDAKRYLRSRLFDMWLSDWSRREDQWRWGVAEGEIVTYEPIPRDRDHAFFKFNDGVLTSIISIFKPNYQSFDRTIVGKNVKGLISASRQMDSYLLAYLSLEDFKEVSLDLQQRLSDDVIEKALMQWPPQIRELTAQEFRKKLRARRKDLPKAASTFYHEINKEVKLAGSDDDDIFKLHFTSDGSVLVQHWSNTKDSAPVLLDQKTYSPSETKSIAIYGLSGADVFQLSGQGKSKIKIQWFGGEGTDKLQVEDDWKVTGKNIVLYDEDDGNEYKKVKKLKVKDHSPKADEFSGDGWLLRHRLH
ncbi:hypothetical protein [Rufibacter roseus]|uniref:Uncharacterized protein n=1 Tax=Rufibacter roseus TaxID=1567108 RepID=A0ABW2DPU8_9BACT|nr:hypothetical protein [Rufibacter roseus]